MREREYATNAKKTTVKQFLSFDNGNRGLFNRWKLHESFFSFMTPSFNKVLMNVEIQRKFPSKKTLTLAVKEKETENRKHKKQ